MWDYSKLDEELEDILNIDMSKFDFSINTDNVNLEEFFEENTNEEKKEETKTIVCPHCGEKIEI